MTPAEFIRYIAKLLIETLEFIFGVFIMWTREKETVESPDKPEKIVVIQTNSIGDVLMSTPLARCLKKKFKTSRIDFIVLSSARSLLENNPNVDRVYVRQPLFWRKMFSKNTLFRENLLVIKKIKNQKYDMCIDLISSFDSIMLASSLKAKETKGSIRRLKTGLFRYSTEKFYSKPVRLKEKHIIKRYLETAGVDVLKCEDFSEECFYKPEELEKAQNFMQKNKLSKNKFVVMHPGSKWPPKRWPEEYFANLIRFIFNELNLITVIIGSPTDKAMLSSIRRMSGVSETIFTADLTFGELACILDQAALFVGNDSGPAHLASTVKVPMILFFGPTDPEASSPLRENIKIFQDKLFCWPCILYYRRDRCQRGINRCLRNIKPERVLVESERMRRR